MSSFVDRKLVHESMAVGIIQEVVSCYMSVIVHPMWLDRSPSCHLSLGRGPRGCGVGGGAGGARCVCQ